MLTRILEPEVMDSAKEAEEYDAMDHTAVNQAFVAGFLRVWDGRGPILDVGTGTAQIPIEFCRQSSHGEIDALDLSAAMLHRAAQNIAAAGYTGRIRLHHLDAKTNPLPDAAFPAVMSNSIIHHIPSPELCFAEMVRLCQPGGTIFVRDLLRPSSELELASLVEQHAAGANDRQRQMFAESLQAALTVAEVQAIITRWGFPADSVMKTSDRHWTWIVRPS
jgi:ubiquinone/menaquinone biosynthesis C-methylase UbiE